MGSTSRMGLLVTSPSNKPVPLSSTSDAGLPPGARRPALLSLSSPPPLQHFLFSWPPPRRRSRLQRLCPAFVITTSTTTVSIAAAPAFVPHRFDPVPPSFPLVWLSLGRAALHSTSRLLTSSTDVKPLSLNRVENVPLFLPGTPSPSTTPASLSQAFGLPSELLSASYTMVNLNDTRMDTPAEQLFDDDTRYSNAEISVPGDNSNDTLTADWDDDLENGYYSEVDELSTESPIEHYKRAINAGKRKATFDFRRRRTQSSEAANLRGVRTPTSAD
ncbi:hypothetical protein C8R43DRAFT_1123915 [Mycena crocata]|nr:hypothetical protein C8R43DRAFT_1123915 [Mycena crocata]